MQELKLRPDGIVEALLELRFTSPEFPELFSGKLASIDFRPEMSISRLPFADMPAPIRRSDPGLLHQALFHAQSADGSRVAKIGERVFSWHALAPYPGWEVFRPELVSTVHHVFSSVVGCHVERLGLRYLNVLKSDLHFVEGLQSTNLQVLVSGDSLQAPMNVNYRREYGNQTSLIRIATPEFVQGPQEDFSLMIDVDISTERPETGAAKEVIQWIDDAHQLLKSEFFGLLSEETIKKLTEDGR